MNAQIQRILAENPGMDELTAYRVAKSRAQAARLYPEVRKAAVAAGRGIYK